MEDWKNLLTHNNNTAVSPVTFVQTCLICGEDIKDTLKIPFCDECRKRARAVLYPESYGKV